MDVFAQAQAPQAAGSQLRPVVAFIGIGDLSRTPFYWIVEELRNAGYVEGKNLELLPPVKAGNFDSLRPLVASAIEKQASVLFTFGSTATAIAKAATSTVPIVMVVNADPVEQGLVKSLARPEANITGVGGRMQDLAVKRIELLRELNPRLARLGVLVSSGSDTQAETVKQIQQASERLKIKVETVELGAGAPIEAALDELASRNVQAMTFTPSATIASRVPQIVRWAERRKIAVIYTNEENVRAGGLISYGSDFEKTMRRAAGYVVRILKGAKPRDLPIDQAEAFRLAVNLKTAREIGIRVPGSVLVRADEVIQ